MKSFFYKFWICSLILIGVHLHVYAGETETPANNIIYYTTNNGERYSNLDKAKDSELIDLIGTTVVSHTYENGQGKIVFADPITKLNEFFWGFSALTSVVLPEGIETIKEAFCKCTSLTSIVIPNSVKRIETTEKGCFYGCTQLQNVTLGSSVESIGYRCFYGCTNLSSITLPDGLKTIVDQAFLFCPLSSITIPKSVSSLGNACFTGISGTITVDPENETYDSRGGCNAIIETSSNTLLYGGVSTVIPNSVVSMASYVFVFCDGLTSIHIPSSVKSIDGTWPVFYNCTNLKDLYVYWKSADDFSAIYKQLFAWQNTEDEHSMITLHVPYGTKAAYEKIVEDDFFCGIVEMDPEKVQVEIADGTAYNRYHWAPSDIVYSRTFNNTNWQALYVPFSIPVETLTAKGLKIAELNDTHQYFDAETGDLLQTEIEFRYITKGMTEPNYPYVIKASSVGDVGIILEDTKLYESEETAIECSTTRQTFTFTGTYAGIPGEAMLRMNYYAMGNGGTLVRAKEDNPGSLKPQRWYMSISNKDHSDVDFFSPSIRVKIEGFDEDATGLDSLYKEENGDEIFDLQGRNMKSDNLKSGIYIRNHKKIIVL